MQIGNDAPGHGSPRPQAALLREMRVIALLPLLTRRTTDGSDYLPVPSRT